MISMLVMVDKYLKMAHFIPCKKTNDANKVATCFLERMWDYMFFQGVSLLIDIQGSLYIFGGHFRKRWVPSSYVVYHITHKQMDGPMWLARVLVIYWEAWVNKT